MISAYLDELQTIKEINKAAVKIGLKRIPLRNVSQKNIYELKTHEIEEIKKIFKESKTKVSMIDITLNYDLYHILDLVKIFEIAKHFNCKNVVIKMPEFSNFQAEKTELVKVIKEINNSFKKEKLSLSFHVDYKINSAYIAYVLKEIKDLKFTFNPGESYLNDRSITTYYRLLRNNINNVIFFDVDENKKPALIGYGKALVLDMIDKLNNDKYRGDLYYDSNLGEYVKFKKGESEMGFIKRLFARKKRKSHQQIDEKLRLNKNEEVEFITLLKSQLKLLEKYQRI